MKAGFDKSQLVCPRDRTSLIWTGAGGTCANGHTYPIVADVPIMLIPDTHATLHVMTGSLQAVHHTSEKSDPLYLDTLGVDPEQRSEILRRSCDSRDIDPVVDFLVSHTNGLMYNHLVGRLQEYPIPRLGVPEGHSHTFLDVGCSWGRWSIAAARKGYNVVGIDPSLGAVLAAGRVAKQLNVDANFLVADARFLPFKDQTFDVVYSYSVLQHFALSDMERASAEMCRVLASKGTLRVQLANTLGARSLYHQVRRRFRQPRGFEVRYLRPAKMRQLFAGAGDISLRPDCYFGLGLQPADRHLMTPLKRGVLTMSELLKRAARHVPGLSMLADSLFVSARRT